MKTEPPPNHSDPAQEYKCQRRATVSGLRLAFGHVYHGEASEDQATATVLEEWLAYKTSNYQTQNHFKK
jgi:hypothetical protein